MEQLLSGRSMKNRVVNSVVLLVLLFMLATAFFPRAALAISDPDSISIERVKVFKGVWEANDWLFICEYDVEYGVTPSEDPEDTYLAAVYDENGVSVGANPLNYYDHNVISVYFTSSQAASKSMDWDQIGSYNFRITGNPSYFPTIVCTNIAGQNCIDRNIQAGQDDFDRGISKNRSY